MDQRTGEQTDRQRAATKAAQKRFQETFAERFWQRVKRTDDVTECWEWYKPIKTPYPMVSCRHLSKFPKNAHVIAYTLTHGSVKEGAHLCHKCGNSKCCNPHHLYEGTAKTNHEDAIRHGTFKPLPHLQGEGVHNAKLTVDTVLFARRVYPLLLRNEKGILAALMGISETHLRRIIRGEGWDHAQPV